MTREELEEFRSLLQAWSDAGSANDGSGDIDATYDALCCFMTENADALLSLAEEARWRSVDERPADEGFVLAWCEGEPIRRIWFSKYIGFEGLGPANYEATHWRPLPKGPER